MSLTATSPNNPVTIPGVPANTYVATITSISAAGTAVSSTSAPFSVSSSASTGLAAPLIKPAVSGSGAQLMTTASSARLELTGVVMWGITDFITQNESTAANCHSDRVAACQKIAAWGGNVIRLRVLADEYVHLHYMGSQSNYIQWCEDWVTAANAAGLYVMICAWDSLDSQSSWNGSGWASNYSQAFGLFAALRTAFNGNSSVFYEPFNEPNGISDPSWTTAMEATIDNFRNGGYQGLLVIDTNNYSHEETDSLLTALEQHDAGKTSSGQHNLAFARHDYCNDYSNNWSYSSWVSSTGGTGTGHVYMETEFGNQNGSSESASWSAAITSSFKTQMFARPNIAGGTAFVFNWVDDNKISNADGTGLTTWGNDVVNWLSG